MAMTPTIYEGQNRWKFDISQLWFCADINEYALVQGVFYGIYGAHGVSKDTQTAVWVMK